MDVPFDYLKRRFSCTCGQEHTVTIEQVEVNETVANDIAEFITHSPWRNLLLAADSNSYRVYGKELANRLINCGVSLKSHVFSSTHDLYPDQEAIESIREAIETGEIDAVLAVGSGVINDIVRYATYAESIPYLVVATAPSMDGYASTVAALQFNGVKTTLQAHAPLAIFADSRVLAEAPWELIQSGFGDLIGKLISLMDWKLSHVLYQEYLCEEAYQLVWQSLNYCIEHVEDIRNRQPQAISHLFAGLINSGIAMAMMENSRPASGSEHHCSHYWDFLAFINRRNHSSHGIQVGYATHWMMDVYGFFQRITGLKNPRTFLADLNWETEIVNRYAEGSTTVLNEQRNKVNWLQEHSKLWNQEEINMPFILRNLEPELACFGSVRQALEKIGIPHETGFIEVSNDILRETLLHAHELRARYTVFDFLVGQDCLEEAVEQLKLIRKDK
ncbi:MAG: hypothetical protein JWN30_2065 [Bacilli bacterium]|nr:hypothetical protein [Bacilli bacterium]